MVLLAYDILRDTADDHGTYMWGRKRNLRVPCRRFETQRCHKERRLLQFLLDAVGFESREIGKLELRVAFWSM
jgi:hypothetical protein